MKVKFLFFVSFFCFLLAQYAQAQYAYFPENGTITYERTFYLHNNIKKNVKDSDNTGGKLVMYLDEILRDSPKEVITKNVLRFNDTETFYENMDEDKSVHQRNIFNQAISGDVKTYCNFKSKTFKKSVSLVGEELQLADSIPVIKWKFTDEYRNILGYDCRRVNGIMQDSVYIVAFYTPQIPVSGGPELINGLPGMILGLAIPSLNLSYFATKVELSKVTVPVNVTKNKKSTPLSKAEIMQKLKEMIKWMGNKDLQRLFL
ncbi:GLPGLI family protein [Sphingobacterium spiritivorum]|uniref:GLPGLI family protein n=1 Tax=Sphingobacterium spiritivorum TaxID=258 RepID=UPI003DA44F2B